MSTSKRPDLTPEDIEKQLEMLRTGRYCRKTVSERFGQTAQAFYMRQARDEEFDAKVLAAMAEGKMALLDELYELRKGGEDGKKRGDWTPVAWLLERIHSVNHDLDQARIEESKAKARALDAANSEEGFERYRSIVAELWGKRPGAKKPADAEAAQDAGS